MGDDIDLILPTKTQCLRYIIDSALHSCRFHYYIHQRRLVLKYPTSEIPHDLSGIGNKYEWPVMRGLALNGSSADFPEIVIPALERHRQQYHHQEWDESAAVDVICALLEPREIYGGPHTFDEILKLESILKNPEPKLTIIRKMAEQMRELPLLNLENINGFDKFPEQIEGVPQKIYQKIYHLALDARIMVELKYPSAKDMS